jgi:hypothetical protein
VGNKGRTRPTKRARRRTGRRAAVAQAPPRTVEPAAPAPSGAGLGVWPLERPRRSIVLPLVGAATAGMIGILVALALGGPGEQFAQTPSPTIEVGTPRGEVIAQQSPTPAPTAQVTPTPEATATPTPQPIAAATPPPTPAAPTPEPTPTPVASTPAPTAVVATAGPVDAVASFYQHVTAGAFDAAYALWSPRMRSTYPRSENLDGRFDQTASIAFSELFIAEQSEGAATVQANFTERYDGGGSREFIGYWRLILTDGRWVLDEPNY